MRRREFISLLGGAAGAWPIAAHAQQPGKLATIGFSGGGTAQSLPIDAFVRRLRELGWIEGRNIAIEFRWAEGRSERFAEIATEFARLRVDVIIVTSTAQALAAKQATSTIPIVFALSADPVGAGLVASLPRPGGNISGLSAQQPELARKRVELLRQIVPYLTRLAIMANVGVSDAATEMREGASAARTIGLDVVTLEIRRSEDIGPALETLEAGRDALLVVGDPLTGANAIRINTLALGARIPTMYPARIMIAAGGLMSYGPSFPDLLRRAGDFVDKILRGAKPADLPVEQPTRFDLVINRITAKALGLGVPDKLLALADEVIE
jgi:putative ABC transport system substrate-binding protein